MDPYVGEIRLFAGNYAPEDWAFCNGQLLNVQQYEALFVLLGTLYGGDGKTTFGLPNLQGRVPLHCGQGPGLTNYALGAAAGSDAVTLTEVQIPLHSHVLQASNTPATTPNPGNTVLPGVANSGFYTPQGSTKFKSVTLANAAIGPVGGDPAQPHDNSMPSIALSYIIALIGIYPVQQ